MSSLSINPSIIVLEVCVAPVPSLKIFPAGMNAIFIIPPHIRTLYYFNCIYSFCVVIKQL